MSFVTVFTVGAMGFVLLGPLVMIGVLLTAMAQPRRLSTTTSSTSDTA